MKKDILVVCYGGGHANMVIPVLKELDKMNMEYHVLALTSAGPKFKKENRPFFSFKDFLNLLESEDQNKVQLYGKELASQHHNDKMGIPFEETVAYLGVNYLENVKLLGENVAQEMLDQVGRHCFLPVSYLKLILASLGTKVVLTTNSPKSEKASIIAAKSLGIKSVRIEDLFIESDLHVQIGKKLGENFRKSIGRENIVPSKVCVMCDYSKKLVLGSNGQDLDIKIGAEDVVVSGQPILQEIDHLLEERKSEQKHQDKWTMTWAHQYGTLDQEAVIKMMLDWMSHFEKYKSEINLNIKLHPLSPEEEREHFFEAASRFPEEIKIIKDEMAPNEVLYHSDLVLSQDSTMLLQAIYMQKPVIILDPNKIRQMNPYVESGVGELAMSAVDLDEKTIEWREKSAFKMEQFQEGLNYLGLKRGGALNIANLLKELVVEERG